MEKKKIDKNTLIYRSVIIILIIMFIVIFVYGLNKVLAMEGTLPPIYNEQGATPPPATAEEGIEFLNKVYERAAGLKPRVSREDTFSVDEDSIETDGSDEVRKTFAFISGKFEEKLEDSFDDFETDFGEEFPGGVMAPQITADDAVPHAYYSCDSCGKRSDSLCETYEECGSEKPYTEKSEDIGCKYIYYSCRSCGERSDVPREECEICGCVYPYNEKYSDEYEVTLYLNDSAVEKAFRPLSKDEIKEIIAEDIADYFDIDDFDVSYDGVDVFYKVKRLEDKLTYLEYRKDMTVNASLIFKGDCSSLGKCKVSFGITEKNKFSFTWPGIELNKHEMSIAPKTTENLLATLTCTDPTEGVVKWTVSDPSLITIDDEGYITSGKETGTAEVKATFMFNGEEYTDSCVVNVRVSVESLKLDKRKASVDVGKELALTAKVSPGDATVQTVKWFSENVKIAYVDDNGVVTGISKGKTTVYALSDDGYYKSSCEVSVN